MLSRHIPRLVLLVLDMLLLWLRICNLSYYVLGNPVFYWAQVSVPNVRKDLYKYSFFPRTIGDWNRLPPHVARATSLEGFKNQLDTLTGYQRMSVVVIPGYKSGCPSLYFLDLLDVS
jgi:hypothetical protein